MNRIIKLIIILYFMRFSTGFGQENNLKMGLDVITDHSSQAILTYLASDWMEGRQPGNKGHEIAADYLASMFQLYGLKSVDIFKDPYSSLENMCFHNNVYFQNFSLLKLTPSDNHKLSIVTRKAPNSIEEEFDYKKFQVVRRNVYQYMNFEYNKNKFAVKRGAVGCLEVNMENEALIYQPINIFRYNLGSFESDEKLEER